MRFFEGYRCAACGRELPAGTVVGECPSCTGPLLAVYDLGLMRRSVRREEFFGPGSGVWRFRYLLPDFRVKVSLGEGNTPTIAAKRLGETLHASEIYVKDESSNPTGSFKARGMAPAVSRLVELGIREASIPSAGNAGLALAAYGAAAGIRCRVYVPSDTPVGVAEECRLYGAEVIMVTGLLPDAAKRLDVDIGADRSGLLATFREPCRVEGKKTMAFELEADVRPDWVVFPTGGGTGIVAFWKAYAELEALGWLKGRAPHLAVVQAAGCAPLVRAFLDGTERAAPWSEPETIASGIRVPASRADMLILRALRESAGAAVAVTDEEILSAVHEMAHLCGLFASPEGAAAWAGLKKLVAAGTVSPSSRIAFVNTAGGARYRFLLDPSRS
jgi:threonine synthase